MFSSLTNFLLSAVVARNTSADSFGGFAIAFSVYLLVLGVSRAATTLPVLVRYSASSEGEWREAAASATGAAIVVGLAAGAVTATAGLAIPGARAPLLALSVCMPGLLLQEAWRHVFIAHGSPMKALVNDVIWTLALVPSLWLVITSGWESTPAFILAWGLAGTVGALVGIAQSKVEPRPTRAAEWVRAHRDISARQIGEFLANTGSTQLVIYSAGAIAGLAAAGSLRGSQVLLGPLNVAFQGIWIVGLSELVRVLRDRPHVFDRTAMGLSGLLGIGGLAYVGIFVVLGDEIGPWLLGDTWPGAEQIFVPMALVAISSGLWLGATVGLRALQEVSRSLRARLVVSAMNVIGGIGGLILGGAEGAAWGLAITYMAGVMIWWYVFWRAPSRRRPTGPAPASGGEVF